MKRLLALSSLILISLISLGGVSQKAAVKNDKLHRVENAVPGRYIVVLNEKYIGDNGFLGETESAAYQLAGNYGANVDKVYASALKGFAAEMSEDAAEILSKDDRVLYVEEDAYVSVSATQSNATWGLDRVDQRNLPLNSAFQYTATGSGVHAYIIDTGIRITHQEFGGRASYAVDVTGDGMNGVDCNGHGTHVAGTVGSSTYGVAKNVTLHSVRVLRCDGSGNISDILAGVNWVTANRINPAVANISITASGTSLTLNNAITSSIAAGVTYSIAAGNFGANSCDYSPASTPNALTVGAIDSNDARPGYSNQGPCLDLYAPGNGIISLSNGDNTSIRSMSGTSMAAPHVAGVAALYLEANPTASPATVSQQILNSTTQGAVWNVDGVSANKLLYTWLGGAQPPPMPARVTIIKQVTTVNGGTASITSFGYAATNLGTPGFALVDNNAPPADRYENPSISLEGLGDITVTESSIAGWSLTSINCVETPAAGMTNILNTTVDMSNRKANIRVEPGESVTCTFNSLELAPTAAPVSVSGRIVNASGRGIRGVSLSLLNANTGLRAYVVTNTFGYYSFTDLSATNFYVITAAAKRMVFTPDSQSFTLNDNLAGVDFVGRSR